MMKKLLIALLLLLPSTAYAQKTKAALTTEVNANFASGTNITAATLRTTVLDIINSYYDLNGTSTLSCAASRWVSALPTLSSITCAQPAFTDITGTLGATQFPALTGDVTTVAGALATTITALAVHSAMLNADVFSTAHSWGGQQTFTSPILTTPALGIATATSIALNGCTIGSNIICTTGAILASGTAGSVSASGADANLAAGGNRAFMDIAGSTVRIGSASGGSAAVGTSIFSNGFAALTFNSSGIATFPNPTIFSGAVTYGGVTLSNAVTGTGNMVLSANPTFTGTITGTAIALSSSFSAGLVGITGTQPQLLYAGQNGTTNPAFNIDSSTAASATGINIKSGSTGAGVSITAIDSGPNTGMSINAKGSGGLLIQNSGTGIITLGTATTISGALTYGGVTLSNSVTGTGGNMVLSNSPTLVTPALGTPTSGIATNLTGIASGLTSGNVTTNANLTGDVTSVGNGTTLTNAPVIAKVLTGYAAGAGTITAADSILTAIQKNNGNDALKTPLTRNVSTGCGLAGGGDLSADRTIRLSLTVNAQVGTTYTVLDADCGKVVSLSNAAPVTVTLPQANGSTFVSGWNVAFQNKGAGTVTITPTTSTVNGGASIALTQNQGMHCSSDGSNYICVLGVGAGAGSGTVTQVICGTGLDGGTITASGTCSVSAARRTLPTVQKFLSGIGTYTTPTNVLWIELSLIGPGGPGGGGNNGTSATSATPTCWNTTGAACTTPVYQAGAGAGGSNVLGGTGGTVSGSGTCDMAIAGGGGGSSSSPLSGSFAGTSGSGGNSSLGGGGPGAYSNLGAGIAGATNSGGGGAGGIMTINTTGSLPGGGGGSGATCRVIINTPAATYTYAVGPSATGATAGTNGTAGGNSGSGGIWVIEHYGT